MRKLTAILTFVFLVCMILSLSACSNELKEYSYYYFNEEVGEFVNNQNVSVSIDVTNNRLMFKDGSRSINENINILNGEAIVADESKYYFNDYYIVSDNSKLGQATMNEAKELNGEGLFNGEVCSYAKGKIINAKNNEIGKYEIHNNYITINYDGKAIELLMFTMSKSDDDKFKTVGFFKDFYTTTRVVASKIENTGFDIDAKYVENDYEGKINLKFFQKDYVSEKITFKVIDNGGYNFRIDDDGNYFFNTCEKETRDKIVISVSVDNLEKKFELIPLFFKIDKEKMFLRYVGDSIDFKDKTLFLCNGWNFDEITYSINVVDGAENVEMADNVAIFKNSGYAVFEVRATAVLDGQNYEMKDRVSINISGKQIEKK